MKTAISIYEYLCSDILRTALNCRYPGLLAQRLLKAALDGELAPYSKNKLDDWATHCTEAEDTANKVEQRVEKSAAARLLEPKIRQQFDAIITGASEKEPNSNLVMPHI